MVYSAQMLWVLQFPDISAHVSSILHRADGDNIMSLHIPTDNMTLVCSEKNHKSEALQKNIYPETASLKITKYLVSTEIDTLINRIKLETQT